jgi:hypothetical protein
MLAYVLLKDSYIGDSPIKGGVFVLILQTGESLIYSIADLLIISDV